MNLLNAPHARPGRTSLAALCVLALAACNNNSGGGTQAPVSTAPVSLLETLSRNGLTTLRQAIEAAGLESTFTGPGPLTLFGPSNAAFAGLPPGELTRLLDPANVAELRALLLYHAVEAQLSAATLEGLTTAMSAEGSDLMLDTPGGVLFVNDARVSSKDIAATNGVLHIVNQVLLPPVSLLETLDARGFTILRELVDLASLGGTLTGGNLTLLAPTDAAFNALPPGRLDDLRDPANLAELTALLEFNLLPGRVSALAHLYEGDIPNINGDRIFACVHGLQLRFNDVRAPRFNIPATDGLLHTLTGVIEPTPPLRDVLDAEGLTVLAGLVDLAGLTPALQGLGARTILAPTDAAFAALPPGELADLQDPAQAALREAFILRHIVEDALQEVEIARRELLTTAGGVVYAVDTTSGLTIGGVTVETHGVLASNGIVHTLGSVLP